MTSSVPSLGPWLLRRLWSVRSGWASSDGIDGEFRLRLCLPRGHLNQKCSSAPSNGFRSSLLLLSRAHRRGQGWTTSANSLNSERPAGQEKLLTQSLTQDSLPPTPALRQTAQDLTGPRSKESVAQRGRLAEMAGVCAGSCVSVRLLVFLLGSALPHGYLATARCA